MKLHIICVAYERPIALRGLIDSFLLQTYENWELSIVHDGKASCEVLKTISLYYKEKRVKFWESAERYGLYGHPNRDAMIQQIKGKKNDFLLITNDDNYYVPKFAEFFMAASEPDVGMVYCNTVHSHADYDINFSRLRQHHIDMGAFTVRLDIAKKVGFKHTTFAADGLYCEECNVLRAKMGLRVVYINKCLFIHN
jgi:glycosyltransferase involved in cell wall biosynthesis